MTDPDRPTVEIRLVIEVNLEALKQALEVFRADYEGTPDNEEPYNPRHQENWSAIDIIGASWAGASTTLELDVQDEEILGLPPELWSASRINEAKELAVLANTTVEQATRDLVAQDEDIRRGLTT
jgi:hypothetical protein